MSNNVYAIPIKKLYHEKDDPKMNSFISSLGIDLNTRCDCKYPTINEIKKAIIDAGLFLEIEQDNNFESQDGWCGGIKELEGINTTISVDSVMNFDEPIKELISFPYGKWETIIKLLFELVILTGPILFYCDSGQMTMINQTKNLREVLKELE
mgnify:CR=1 FL=1